MSSATDKKNARYAKITPGVALYTSQVGGVGQECESSAQLFGRPFYVFPPSPLDEKNYDAIPGLRFLCIISTRARTQNNVRYFPTPQAQVEWINYMQDTQGLTSVVGDIALETLNMFGEVDEQDYFDAKAQDMGRTRKFVLSDPDDAEDVNDTFSNPVPDAENDPEEGNTFNNQIDKSMLRTPSVEDAEGNSGRPRS